MIVTKKNPLDNLSVLRHVQMVVKDGVVYEHPQVKKLPEIEAEMDKFNWYKKVLQSHKSTYAIRKRIKENNYENMDHKSYPLYKSLKERIVSQNLFYILIMCREILLQRHQMCRLQLI